MTTRSSSIGSHCHVHQCITFYCGHN